MSNVAVFWDRDDTLIRDPGYISNPDQVTLLPGSATALKMLSGAGFENIIVTNQSGIARGLFDEATLERIHDRLVALLVDQGARLDAIYCCPYLNTEEAVVEQYRQDSELRKPKPGMILKAAFERKIDLAGSWVIGNSLPDAQAGKAAGCRTVLINKDGKVKKGGDVDFIAESPEEAARIVLKYTRTNDKPQSSSTPEPPEKTDASAAILQEILAFLRTADRRSRAYEFSLAKLAGSLLQMLVIAAALWAIFGWLRSEGESEVLIRLQLATLLQVAALTCFILPSKK